MTQEIAIIKQENIQTIVSAAPQSYQDNRLSREKCIEAGQAILDAIQHQGMTDELDQRAAIYIEKARKTVKRMNERRLPVTKLFDDIRKEFTAMENAIDPLKSDTIPYKLQQIRNQFAAKKRAEEEERRRREYERQQAEKARARMKQDIEEDFKSQFQQLVNKVCNDLSAIDNAVNLANYDASFKQIQEFSSELPADFLYNLHTFIRIPAGVSVEEIRKVEIEAKERLGKQFTDQYDFEVDSTKQYIIDRLPSKKANLERIKQANEEEAARIKEEMEARQKAEAERMEKERAAREAEEKRKAEMERGAAEISSLFNNAQATMAGYQPKIKVDKKINLLNPEGIMPVIALWWSREGYTLSVEELSKMFKKQITFCEKLANKEDIYVTDESVEYVDEVKAK